VSVTTKSPADATAPRETPRRAILLAVALLVAGAAPAQTPAPAPAPRLNQADAQAAVAAILPELQAIRGFSFKAPVPVTVINDKQAREYALARFHKMTPEAKIRADQTAYRLLGLIPKDVDVLKTLLDVLEEQAGGFYDPETKSFYLLDDMPKDATALLVAHEMTHALEDQRYDLDAHIAAVDDDDDASFALSAVAEGSATAAAAVYVAHAVADGRLTADAMSAMGRTVPTERLNGMPPVMRRELLGPYVLGLSFLARGALATLQQGYPVANADAVWKRLPRSSEQILHPEKYWDPNRRDEPKYLPTPKPTEILGKGFTLAGSGILGELTLGCLVGAKTPDAAELESGHEPWTNDAASGWGGDRYALWTRGDVAIVLLATVWDTAKDAEEFAAALPADRPGFAFKRSGTKVGIVAGPAGDSRDALLDYLVKP
jgi:hypothetical protein